MSDKTREVYKDGADVIPELNPFVDMPRMRVSAVNRLNDLIKRDNAMPIKRKSDYSVNEEERFYYLCPNCDKAFWTIEGRQFCDACGQRLDVNNFAF